jgi:FlaA1/EpsC-like NDP-sugar epimerase
MGLINKTALVTGAAGSIGHHPIDDLYQTHDKITREFKNHATGIPNDLSLPGV